MDVDAKAWMRAWLMGAATAGLIGSDLFAGDTQRAPKRSAPPALLKPSASAVRQTTHQQTDGEIVVAESEIEQQLRLLYERDGREMPDLNLSPAQPQPQTQTQAQPGPRIQQTPQPRYSAAPPAPPKTNSNKFTSFFKKLVPGGNKSQAAQTPPRQLPTTPPLPPAYRAPPPPAPAVDFEETVEPVETEIPFLPAAPAETFADPVTEQASPIESSPPMLDDDFPDPFGEAVDTAAPAESDVVPEGEELNPYTGKSLAEPETPAALTDTADDQPVITSSVAETDDSTAAKMRRIIQRTDMKGLKGFCPVTLRDQRELADSNPEFVGAFRGQKFYFASAAALAKFETDPARYAPAAYGADVVVLTNAQDVVEGTLDYAAWFKGRLYLFESQQTHDMFVTNPDKYATPPGIE